MYEKYVKRILDCIFSTLLIILTSPIMLIVAIAIKIEDPRGPILFKQKRPGKDEKVFTIYKFRTMKTATHDNEGKILSDMDRITFSGKILRKLSLDEFPQFFNVFLGQMSFIGPRPLLVQYLEHYNIEQRRRHNVRPGISGWAQVNGRNAITWEEKFKLDVWYADNISFTTDVKVLIKTIKNVIMRKDINSSEETTMTYFGE